MCRIGRVGAGRALSHTWPQTRTPTAVQLQEAVAHGDADQRVRDALGRRPRDQRGVRACRRAVLLVDDLAAVEHTSASVMLSTVPTRSHPNPHAEERGTRVRQPSAVSTRSATEPSGRRAGARRPRWATAGAADDIVRSSPHRCVRWAGSTSSTGGRRARPRRAPRPAARSLPGTAAGPGRVPLEVEGERRAAPVARPHRVLGVVEVHPVPLVDDGPLQERRLAHVVGPEPPAVSRPTRRPGAGGRPRGP